MSEGFGQTLLEPHDPSPVSTYNSGGTSAFVLLGDHAGNAVPRALGSLGLDQSQLGRHIAWDIGIAPLGRMLADKLDAVFVSQSYSRLVIDCNRDPERADAVTETSDGVSIPGNIGLSLAERDYRMAEIHRPYHEAITQELQRRDIGGRRTILISLHSFTPVMGGIDRPWEIGVLHERGHDRLARALLRVLEQQAEVTVGDNQPYAMDGTDFTIPHHAYAASRPCVEIEIRQDCLATGALRSLWADRLCRWLNASRNVDQ